MTANKQCKCYCLRGYILCQMETAELQMGDCAVTIETHNEEVCWRRLPFWYMGGAPLAEQEKGQRQREEGTQ